MPTVGAGTGLLAERPRPAAVRDSPRAAWFVVGTVCVGAFMGQLDASVVTLTFPALRTAFHTSLASVSWVSLAYLVTLGALLVPAGRLSDAVGRKRMYLLGFGVFTLASAGCGLAPSLPLLVAGRLAQAVGAAVMQANSTALITTSVPRVRLRSALGVQAAAQAAGLAAGPTIGGLLMAGPGWRWVFLINVPVGVVGLVAGHYLLPRTRDRHPIGRFDHAGLVLLAAGSTTALLAVSTVSGLTVPGWFAAALATAAVAALAGLRRWERRTADPLLPPALLSDRSVATGLLTAGLGYLVLFGPLVLGPVVLAGLGLPAGRIGLALTALPLGFALSAVGAGRLVPRRYGNRARGTAGLGLAAAALLAQAALPVTPAGLVVTLLLVGLGLGLFVPANNAAVMAAMPGRSAGTASGLVNMTRALGTAVGVAAVTLVLHATEGAAVATGAKLSTLLLGFLAAVAGVAGLVGPRRG